MAYLNYDVNQLSNLLARPRGLGEGLQAIGQTMQQFAQIKQQKAESEMKNKIYEMQLEKGKLDVATQQVDEVAGFMNRVQNFYNERGELVDPVGAQATYNKMYFNTVEKNPELAKIIPTKIPDPSSAKAFIDQSYKWHAKTEEIRLAEERIKASKDKDKTERKLSIPQVTSGDIESAAIYTGGQTVGGGEEELKGEIPDEDLRRIADAVAAEKNLIIAQVQDRKLPPMTEQQAQAYAFQRLAASGAIEYKGENYLGNNYALNKQKLDQYLGLPMDERIPTPDEIAKNDPRVEKFMQANGIQDYDEAVKILKEAGRL